MFTDNLDAAAVAWGLTGILAVLALVLVRSLRRRQKSLETARRRLTKMRSELAASELTIIRHMDTIAELENRLASNQGDLPQVIRREANTITN